jgi:hypothetical protein
MHRFRLVSRGGSGVYVLIKAERCKTDINLYVSFMTLSGFLPIQLHARIVSLRGAANCPQPPGIHDDQAPWNDMVRVPVGYKWRQRSRHKRKSNHFLPPTFTRDFFKP